MVLSLWQLRLRHKRKANDDEAKLATSPWCAIYCSVDVAKNSRAPMCATVPHTAHRTVNVAKPTFTHQIHRCRAPAAVKAHPLPASFSSSPYRVKHAMPKSIRTIGARVRVVVPNEIRHGEALSSSDIEACATSSSRLRLTQAFSG